MSHNTVRLIQGGSEYFELLYRLIEEAKHLIHLQFYIFEQDHTGNVVAEKLKEAVARGVKVYVLLDAYGSQGLSRAFVRSLIDAGIFMRRFRPLFKSRRFYLGRRLHHKIVVVDADKALVSGLNISDRYNDMPGVPAWLDWALYVKGEAAMALEEICKQRLQLRYKLSLPESPLPKAHYPVRVRVNDWVRRKRQIYRTYLEMFQEAESHIIIMSAYFLPGRRFRRQLAAARRRGVRVAVILTANADVILIKYAERFIYRWLFKHGIEVYEYTKSIVHGKMATCDGEWMTIGSYNVNNLSAYASVELNLDVKHSGFVSKVEHRLEEIIRNDCVRITEKSFLKKYNWFNFLVHKTVYGIFRFLFFLSTKQVGD